MYTLKDKDAVIAVPNFPNFKGKLDDALVELALKQGPENMVHFLKDGAEITKVNVTKEKGKPAKVEVLTSPIIHEEKADA